MIVYRHLLPIDIGIINKILYQSFGYTIGITHSGKATFHSFLLFDQFNVLMDSFGTKQGFAPLKINQYNY